MNNTSSNLLQIEVVNISGPSCKVIGLGVAMLVLMIATPTFGLCQQALPPIPQAKEKKKVTSSKPELSDVNQDTAELKRRYEALTSAAQSGDPSSVSQSAPKVAATALRGLANLRMLQGAFPQAVELYRQSLGLEPSRATELNLAIAALRAGNPDLTIQQTSSVLQAEPQNARAWHLQGNALMAKEDYKQAAESLQHSLKLNNDINAQYALALSFLKMGEKPKAEQIFNQVIQTYGDRAIWHVVFAGAYRESKNPDDAVQEFKRAIAMDPTVGHAYFFLGLTLLENNHWAQTEESLAAFREAVKQDPKDFFSNFYLGAGESELKMFKESDQHLKVAAEIQPNMSEVWLYLGLNAFQQNNFADAKTWLLKAIQLTGQNEGQNAFRIRRAYIALGRIAFNEGNKKEADVYIQRAKELQNKSLAVSAESIAETTSSGGMGDAAAVMPNLKVPKQNVSLQETPVDPTAPVDPSVTPAAPLSREQQEQVKASEKQLRAVLSSTFNDWGTADARQEMFRIAVDRFREAERWDNSTPGLMRNLGVASLKIADYPEAIRALRIAIELEPTDQLARARLALALFTTDQYAEAVKVFEPLRSALFEDPRLAYAFAYSLVKVNQPKRATEVINGLMATNVPPEMLLSIGDLYGVIEDYEHAVATYRKLLSVNPGAERAHYKMGAALLRLSRPAEAVPELQAELRISPDDVDVQYNLAYALLQTSQKEQALSLLRSILAKNPDHPQAQYQIGKTLLDEGQVAQAVDHLEIAAKLDPTSDYIHYQLLTAYRRSGRTADVERESKIYRDLKTRKREKAVIPQPEPKQQ
jgi:tetratricopeptide (TPR) repeat protein